MNRTILPKEEWTTYEENKERGYYLKGIIEEIEAEQKEEEEWENRIH